jgi:hypothetical protein
LHDLHIWTFGRNGHLTRKLRRVAKSPFFEITVILRGPHGDRNPIDKARCRAKCLKMYRPCQTRRGGGQWIDRPDEWPVPKPAQRELNFSSPGA